MKQTLKMILIIVVILFLIIICIFLVIKYMPSPVPNGGQWNGEYKYQKSGYDECDFSSKESCKQNNCIWRLTTDAIVLNEPIPVTCCPADKIPTLDNNDPTDICMILHG
ncbi:MAG: hypothetical protein AABW91_01570 [Nanoarchaeota archaeon]